MFRTLVAFVLLSSLQANADQQQALRNLESGQSPYQVLQTLFESAKPVTLTDVPSLYDGVKSRVGQRMLNMHVGPATKISELRPGGWHFRTTVRKKVETKPAVPGAGPLFPPSTSQNSVNSRETLVTCGRESPAVCSNVLTAEAEAKLFEEVKDVEFVQSPEGLRWVVKTEKAVHTHWLRRAGEYFVWKFVTVEGGKSDTVYGYAWPEKF